MLLDLMAVVILILVLTLLTARKNRIFQALKQNALIAGALVTVVQLMIFVTQLEKGIDVAPDFIAQGALEPGAVEPTGILVSLLVKFRAFLVGVLFYVIFMAAESVYLRFTRTSDCTHNSDCADAHGLKDTNDYSCLSRRELEVARLAAKGYTNSQIAEELFVSTETVKSHMNSIFEKLGIKSRRELMD